MVSIGTCPHKCGPSTLTSGAPICSEISSTLAWAARCPVYVVYHEKVVLEYCLWRGYVPAGESKARRTYSRLCLFTTRLNRREPIESRPWSVHCRYYSTYTLTTRSRSNESLNAATWFLLSVMYIHHSAIWCLDTVAKYSR